MGLQIASRARATGIGRRRGAGWGGGSLLAVAGIKVISTKTCILWIVVGMVFNENSDFGEKTLIED